MDDQSKKPNGRIGRVMRLGRNKRTVPFPEDALREMLGTVTGEDFVAIPELERARVKVAGFFGFPSEHLLFCNGSDAGIKSVFEALVRSGDEVVLIRPMLSQYAELCRLFGATQTVIQYRHDLTFDFDDLLDVMARAPRLVTLINSNNPEWHGREHIRPRGVRRGGGRLGVARPRRRGVSLLLRRDRRSRGSGSRTSS